MSAWDLLCCATPSNIPRSRYMSHDLSITQKMDSQICLVVHGHRSSPCFAPLLQDIAIPVYGFHEVTLGQAITPVLLWFLMQLMEKCIIKTCMARFCEGHPSNICQV